MRQKAAVEGYIEAVVIAGLSDAFSKDQTKKELSGQSSGDCPLFFTVSVFLIFG